MKFITQQNVCPTDYSKLIVQNNMLYSNSTSAKPVLYLLFVSGDRDLLQLLTLYFDRAGHVTCSATNQAEAFALMRVGILPDLIIWDADLLEYDFLGVVRYNAQLVQIPVIVLKSGFLKKPTSAHETSMVVRIGKPIILHDIQNQVDSLLYLTDLAATMLQHPIGAYPS